MTIAAHEIVRARECTTQSPPSLRSRPHPQRPFSVSAARSKNQCAKARLTTTAARSLRNYSLTTRRLFHERLGCRLEHISRCLLYEGKHARPVFVHGNIDASVPTEVRGAACSPVSCCVTRTALRGCIHVRRHGFLSRECVVVIALLERTLAQVVTDEVRVRQIAMNGLTNAIKYSDAGANGPILVAVTVSREDAIAKSCAGGAAGVPTRSSV
jgi:hypothetical protein